MVDPGGDGGPVVGGKLRRRATAVPDRLDGAVAAVLALELLDEGAADAEAVGDGLLGGCAGECGVENALSEDGREGGHQRWGCAPTAYDHPTLTLNRLMANGQDGPAYSDGGDWLPSNLMVANDGAGAGLAVLDGGPLHSHALAVVQNESSRYRIYETTNGAMWTDIGPAPVRGSPSRPDTYLVPVPGGLVAAYGTGTDVWLSGDAGRSWRLVFDVDGPLTSNDQVKDMEVGPDGRLYAAVDSQQSQDALERGGIYRTVEPLFVVAGEAAPETAPGVGVAVRPNPASGRVEVLVSLVSAGSVRVAVFDAQGREVALAFDGAMPAGERVVGVETGAWPAGVYVVRVSAAGGGGSGAGAASARFTVAR